MGRVAWTRGDSPLAPFAEGYRAELARLGFTPGVVKQHLMLMGQLSRWMSSEGLDVGQLTPARLEEFRAARRAGGQRRVPTERSLRLLFDLLRGLGVMPPPPVVAMTATEEFLARYRRYLIHDRGLAPSTVKRYERMARVFLKERSCRVGGSGAEGLTAEEVLDHLLRECSRLAVSSAKRQAADLRSLLRFLYLDGVTSTDLGAALPPVAGWRNTALPPTLRPVEVAALLEGCDRDEPHGLRDFTILVVLARLGLRSGEVARLQLGDIDWRSGELIVRGKARRDDRMPLPVDVGEALVAYLRDGRPKTACRNVFLTNRAPFRAIHPSSITNILYRACRRAGLRRVGPHRLRHALATELLRRGAKLVEVSQVLRHRDLATTSVYAKVDLGTLRDVAQPWPGGQR
jgi:site-specific recombinase XerD